MAIINITNFPSQYNQIHIYSLEEAESFDNSKGDIAE
jgi:hypothetical protein